MFDQGFGMTYFQAWFFSGNQIESSTAVLRYLLCKKNEPELSLHFLVTSYDGQGHVYKRKIIRGADLEKTYIWVILYYKIDQFCPLKSNFHPFPAIWPYVGSGIHYYLIFIICWYK